MISFFLILSLRILKLYNLVLLIFEIYLHRTILHVFFCGLFLSFNIMFVRLIDVFHVIIDHFQNLFIHSTINGIKFGFFQMRSFGYISWCTCTWIPLVYICLILLCHWVFISSFLLGNDKLFYKVLVPMYTSTRKIWVLFALYFCKYLILLGVYILPI